MTGKTDETVDVKSTIPAGWKLVGGQVPAETVTDDTKNTIITITYTLIPSDGDDTPGDNPGDKPGSGEGPDQPGLGPEVTPPGTKLRTPPTVVIKPGKTTSNIKINTIPKETKIETTKAASKGYRNTNAPLHEDAKSPETKYVTPKATMPHLALVLQLARLARTLRQMHCHRQARSKMPQVSWAY